MVKRACLPASKEKNRDPLLAGAWGERVPQTLITPVRCGRSTGNPQTAHWHPHCCSCPITGFVHKEVSATHAPMGKLTHCLAATQNTFFMQHALQRAHKTWGHMESDSILNLLPLFQQHTSLWILVAKNRNFSVKKKNYYVCAWFNSKNKSPTQTCLIKTDGNFLSHVTKGPGECCLQEWLASVSWLLLLHSFSWFCSPMSWFHYKGGPLLMVADGPISFRFTWLWHLGTPPEREHLFSKNSSKSLGPGMVQATCSYVHTCNRSLWPSLAMTTTTAKTMGREEWWCGPHGARRMKGWSPKCKGEKKRLFSEEEGRDATHTELPYVS